MKRSYMVIYERVADNNRGGWAQDIGGAVGAGDSLDLARPSLREGIMIQLEYLAGQGLDAPPATSTSIDFSEFDPDPSGSHYEIEWMTINLPETASTPRDKVSQAA